MKLGAIVYGLSEVGTTEFPHGSPDFLLKTPEEDAELSILKDHLKSVAKTELGKLDLKSEDILWLSPRTKVLQKEVVPFPDASVIKMWIDDNGARRSYADGGDLDPRVYMPGFKAEGYTHLLLLKLPFLIYDVEAFLEKIILCKDNTHFIASYNYSTEDVSDYDESPIVMNVQNANHHFMMLSNILKDVDDAKIKTVDWTSCGFKQLPDKWVDDVGQPILLRVLRAGYENAESEDIEYLVKKVGIHESCEMDMYQHISDYCYQVGTINA